MGGLFRHGCYCPGSLSRKKTTQAEAVRRKEIRRQNGRYDAPAETPSAAGKMESERAADSTASLPGTGFGDELYSRARMVQFEPGSVASGKYYYKYEWRETLCDKGIITCTVPTPNRFWPEQGKQYGYAPHPPGK